LQGARFFIQTETSHEVVDSKLNKVKFIPNRMYLLSFVCVEDHRWYLKSLYQESPTFLKLSYFLVQIHAKGYQLDAHNSEIKIAQFAFKYVIIKLNIQYSSVWRH